MRSDVTIDELQRQDWNQVRRIFGEGLRTGLAAFTTEAPSWDDWDKDHLTTGRLVARIGGGQVVGFAALTPVPDT